MGFLKHIRSKSRLHSHSPEPIRSDPRSFNHRGYARDPTTRLPDAVLELIFSYVCPHTQDDSYFSAEDSLTENGCMLCDLRDLAHCAVVCRRWRKSAQLLLYWSVRIDAVHYCDRERLLADKRRRRSFLSRNADPVSAPQERMRLFSETVRSNQRLAAGVHFLKIAYMTRENCKTDLARAVSVLPNLRYVDVPEGFFSDDPSCQAVRAELQQRCPDIRKMKYVTGSENSFTQLASGRWWQNLDVLELRDITVNPHIFLAVLGSLPALHSLELFDFPWMDDTIFGQTAGVPQFPPLQKLSITNVPNLTAKGLETYLSRVQNREVLADLTLSNTGVEAEALPVILSRAPFLLSLALRTTVKTPLSPNILPLASTSLQTLHYELTSATAATVNLPQAYYSSLISSLHQGALSQLTTLFVRSSSFPESLLLVPPRPTYQSNTRYTPKVPQQLAIYSKGEDATSWEFTTFNGTGGAPRREERPLSTLSIGNGMMAGGFSPVLGGGARKSLFMKDGVGGFLEVPGQAPPGGRGWV
ncbi:MAG: hypothetical protein M1814_004273 [Vezdaea aestivalis]|nr:MAG: hypothetical protein M1814_004273 [Vezdaea aestivalis]